MNTKVLHICQMDKFIPPFVRFVNDNYAPDEHKFFVFGKKAKRDEVSGINVVRSDAWFAHIFHYLLLIIDMHRSKKIILHGLFNVRVIFLLFFMPWLLGKSYWVVWGGDLYSYKLAKSGLYARVKEYVKSKVIKRIGNFVVFVRGDYELLQLWYGATGGVHSCIMYPSNLPNLSLTKKLPKLGVNGKRLRLLVGNSASPTNNHIEIFDIIESSNIIDFDMIVPLSYGVESYRNKVIEEGLTRFGNRFKALVDFIPIGAYLDVLDGVDVAIFNHSRQQGVGNTIVLLASGKTVYMSSHVSQWDFFTNIGVVLHDIESGSFKVQDDWITLNNQQKIREYFSLSNYKQQLDALFL